MERRRVLFVFAHQDDEIAAAARILRETRSGADVHCVFLTDGSAGGVPSAVRDEESRQVLALLGVRPDAIAFLGSREAIPDGSLIEHLDRAHRSMREHLAGISLDEMFCLAWEGGHQDHDASHVLTLAIAAERSMLDRCWELPFYQGRGLTGPLFRVFSPLPPRNSEAIRIGVAEGLRIVFLPRFYRSQRRSWLALLPGLVLGLVVRRRITIRRVDPRRVLERPHEGSLFYERRFRFPYERFRAAAAPFLARHLVSTS